MNLGKELLDGLVARAEEDASAFTLWELDRLEDWQDGRRITEKMIEVLRDMQDRLNND